MFRFRVFLVSDEGFRGRGLAAFRLGSFGFRG